MSNLIDVYEQDGLREDMLNMLGMYDDGQGDHTISDAKTLVTIRRLIERGPINATTALYDASSYDVIYSGPGRISPVTYRRDRQEQGGQESVRIRQYRGLVPWDAGDIHLDDVLTVNFCTDPDMDGRILDVSDVLYESELIVRRISLVDTTKDSNGLDC